MDEIDTVFAEKLRHKIQVALVGDANNNGLYYQVRAARSWEQHQRIVGQIEGLEVAGAFISDVLREFSDQSVNADRARSMN